MAPRARVFTIPASVPFLPRLIGAVLDGTLVAGCSLAADPLALAAATIFLPTRRACRLARDVFLDALDADAALLPQILAIGDVDEDELAFADAAAGPTAEAALELAPALGSLERKILLARLVLQWAASPELHGSSGAPLVAQSPAAAFALADGLSRLIDDMTVRQIPWSRLDDLVPERFDTYWQLSLRFLKIAREAWPGILGERGAIEAAARRDRLIAAAAERLASGNDAPVIAAGSTGSMPATAALLHTVARLPHGAVVLPGLDTDLDAPSWALIGGSREGGSAQEPVPGHPQFAMQALLARLGIGRDAVTVLAAPAAHGRERLLSEALRPAGATERWKDRLDGPVVAAAVEHIAVIEAANSEEEALAIAVALREAIEVAGARAALVTPDRTLARRVIAALGRWNVAVDDSGGDPLTDAPAGIFARLVAEAGLGGLSPVTLLALLKHRLCRLGARAGADLGAVSALERAILRGPRPRAGTAGLAHALAALPQLRLHRSDPRARLRRFELDAASGLVERLRMAFAPLEGLDARPRPFGEIAARHRDVVAALGRDDAGASAVFAGDDGEALALLFEEIAGRPAHDDLLATPADYGELFRAISADRVVRRPITPGARVRIFGPLEARLQSFDRVVLGGLVEGTWPPETRADPWLSRPMRHDLGLDLPERRIGLSAHDFAQSLGAPDVVLVRAAKVAGVPTVASRFVQRLAAVAGEAEWRAALARGARILALARRLDQPPGKAQPIKAPAPTPPRHARPARLSVTDVEHWLRDPYTIYAKHILRIVPLDAVDTPPGARDRGSVIHEAIAAFTTTFAAAAPADPLAELLRLGKQHFAPLADYPEARAFWWPRFVRIASWFAGWDAGRRRLIAATHAEIRGEIDIGLGERSFRLTARADRIDRLTDGRYAIVDYKTGEARTEKQVRSGLAPQLTLEGAILRGGGFGDIAAPASVADLVYVTLRGGNPPGAENPIEFAEGTPDSQADTALRRFAAMAQRFEDETEPYRSLVHPMWKRHYGDYDHLARVKEWSASGGATDEAGE
ncbi:MAG: double-strand break repair protein AddB [Xanthobacteraceae bacterium]